MISTIYIRLECVGFFVARLAFVDEGNAETNIPPNLNDVIVFGLANNQRQWSVTSPHAAQVQI